MDFWLGGLWFESTEESKTSVINTLEDISTSYRTMIRV